jgi:hypothetical protein
MLADLQDECPNTWKSTKMDIPGGEIWLNATIAFADCVGEGKPAANAQAAAASSSAPAEGSASSATKIDVVSAGLAVGAMLMFWVNGWHVSAF